MLDRLVVMDKVPTRIVARDFSPAVANAYWFFIFSQVGLSAAGAAGQRVQAPDALPASCRPISDRYPSNVSIGAGFVR